MTTNTISRTTLLSQIKTSNLVSYTFVHDKVETNFKLIVDALTQNEDQLSMLKLANQKTNLKLAELQNMLKSEIQKSEERAASSGIMNDRINILTERQNVIDKKHQILKNDYNQHKQIQRANSARNSPNPQQKLRGNSTQSAGLVENEKTIENLMKTTSAHEDILTSLQENVSNNGKNIENNHNSLYKQIDTLRKQIVAVGKDSDAQKIWEAINQLKNQLPLQQNLREFIDKSLKEQDDVNIEKFDKLEDELTALKQQLDSEKKLRLKISQQVWNLKEAIFKIEADKLDGQTISPKIFLDMEKDITEVKKKLGIFFKQVGKDFTGSEKKSLSSFSRLNNQDTKLTAEGSLSRNQEEDVDLKNEMIKKMKQQRIQILKAIKKADSNSQDAGRSRLMLIEQSIRRLQHLIAGKSDSESLRKLVAYLQNKINYIFQMVSAADEEDALIAKRKWFCLSCDKKLEDYKGRVGQFLNTSQQLKGSTTKHQTIGGGMSMRSRSKVDLPTVNEKSKRQTL